MKSTLFQVGEQQELPELLQHPLYGRDVSISVIIGIDEDVVQIYDNKDIKLFSKNLVDVSLEAGWRVGEIERHHLILEVTVLGSECDFLLVFFADSHSMVDTGEVKLSESFCSS